MSFDSKGAWKINKARLDHLDSLGLFLGFQRVLEVGCGVGFLTGYFEDRNCYVESLDIQQENLDRNLLYHPWRRGRLRQGDIQEELARFYSIIFCYGTLYHLERPARAIANMAEKCKKLFLLETMVHWEDDGKVHPVTQWPGEDQSNKGNGCRPSRNWIMDTLREHYDHVYVTSKQPNHPEFPRSWPQPEGTLCRAVFVASSNSLHTWVNQITLTAELPTEPEGLLTEVETR